jgi:hypothetical protein
MSPPTSDDVQAADELAAKVQAAEVLAALRDFTARIDELDPAGPLLGEVDVRLGGRSLRLPLRVPVAQALVAALRDYHDPRDQGDCDHCGGRRIDANFVCRDCGRPNGVFGQLVAERAALFTESAAIEPAADAG